MSSIDNVLWCKNCGIELSLFPFVVNSFKYCCEDCHLGIPCKCGERMELNDDRRSDNQGWTNYPAA